MPDQAPVDNTPTICYASRPCGRWRTCHRCAARRQARIADAAENLAERCGQLRWHILYPVDKSAEGLRAVRDDWLRAAAPIGAIWTVEQSQKNHALHLNVITPAGSNHEPLAADHWQQIIRGDVRAVGAYIAKRRQMPRPADYGGRLFGTAGQLWQVLSQARTHPAIQAAAAQFALNSHAMKNRALECLHTSTLASIADHNAHFDRLNAPPPATREEYRTIASRWLPDLLEWKDQNRPKSAIETAREWMKHEEN